MPEQRAAAVPKVNADKPVGQWDRMMAAGVVGDRVTIVLNRKEHSSFLRKWIDQAEGPWASELGESK